MRHRGILLCAVLLLAPAAGIAAEQTLPRGWFVAGSKPADYEFGTDSTVTQQSTKSAYIKFRGTLMQGDAGFGTLMQTIAAEAYRGQRLRFSGYMKTLDAVGATMWMRVDGSNGVVLSFDNMGNRPVKGSTDWKRYDIVLDVPPSAAGISFGFYLESRGTVWADAFTLEPVGLDVPVTGSAPRTLPKSPVNLNFDQ